MDNVDIDRALKDSSQHERLLDELQALRHPRALSVALRLLNDSNWATRAAAVSCVGALGDLSRVPEITRYMEDEERLVRIASIEAVVALGSVDEVGFARLLKRLEDESETVRAYAEWALGRLGNARAAAELSLRLDSEESDVARAGILEGVYRLSKLACYLELLKGVLSCQDPEARAFASNSLVGVASGENVQGLIECLQDAVHVESLPAIRSVLEDNLDTLRGMDADGEFGLE